MTHRQYGTRHLWASVLLLSFCTTPALADFSSTEVKGGVVSVNKADNIFDPSPGVKSREISLPPKAAAKVEKQEEAVQSDEGSPGAVLSTEEISQQAAGNTSLMQALENSRKLKARLQQIQVKKSDNPAQSIENIKKSLQKQEKIKEEEEYQF